MADQIPELSMEGIEADCLELVDDAAMLTPSVIGSGGSSPQFWALLA
jgi:hypothetical protein